MSLRFMLATDTVSYALQGEHGAPGRILAHHPSSLTISTITLAELHYGAERRGSKKLHKLIDSFTKQIRPCPFDEEAALKFGTLGGALADAGRLLAI